MTQRLQPIDAFFLLSESRRAPWHAAGCQVFDKPAKTGETFVAKLVADLHRQQAVFPFNVALDPDRYWPSWREVSVDMDYHVRHQDLPDPGTERELMTAMEHFYSSTLDRNLPLWEYCVFDKLEGNRFAIGFKIHHSLMDGHGGLGIILNALTMRKSERKARALWGDNSDNDTMGRKSRPKAAAGKQNSPTPLGLLRGLGREVQSTLSSLNKVRPRDLAYFRAPRSVLNHQTGSSARRFGIGDLSLSLMKKVAKTCDASVNDVLLYAVDAGLHRYLSEQGQDVSKALVCAMPISVRSEGSAAGGNQAGLLAVDLGLPGEAPLDRLARIKASTARAKGNIQHLPNSFLVGYGLATLGAPLLLEQVPGASGLPPIVNLGVSNVSPPPGSKYLGKSLYLRGARLRGLYTQPILPPSVLLNVTAASFEDQLCLGIGSTKEAIADPMLLASHIVDALDQLADQIN
jgi:WS/DGAT/MGAT family acyltransferase